MKATHSDSPRAPTAESQTPNSSLAFLYGLALPDLTSDNRDAALETIIELTAAHFSADRAYVLLKDNETNELQIAARACPDAATDTPGTISKPITNRTMETGQAVFVQNATKDEEFFAEPGLQGADIKSVICAPLKGPQQPLGVIYLDTSSAAVDKWDRQDLDLLNFAAGHLGAAIAVVSLQQERDKNQCLITAGQVALNISHSVKNILQLVSGAIEMLDFGLRTDQIHRVKRSWKILKPNLERIKKLTLDMLDFNRQRRLEAKPCDFNTIIQAAVESLQTQLKEKKTKLHIRIDQKIPVAQLDDDKIHQMVVNLILNAIDIVDKETGTVTVETRHLPAEAALELSISDNGPALSGQEKEEIFLPFQSVRNKTGSGLGLAIAKKIVEQHKGRIEVESEPDKGTTFRVTLPAKSVQ